jgi:hypothetical protein
MLAEGPGECLVCPEAGRAVERAFARQPARPIRRMVVTAPRQKRRFVIYCSALSLVFTKGMTPMDNAEAESLASKHAALHAMIDEEEHQPHPNEDLLHELKKEKLRLKDALAGHYAH